MYIETDVCICVAKRHENKKHKVLDESLYCFNI